MQGFQLTFFTQQDRRHSGKPLGEWLVDEARRQGLGGATLLTGAEGFGHGGKIHSAHFFELADQPVEVTMAGSVAEAERFLARLGAAGVKVFYVKTPIEYGTTGEV
jgi:PII-like signaling protein